MTYIGIKLRPTLKITLKINLKLCQSLDILSMSASSLKETIYDRAKHSPFLKISHPAKAANSSFDIIENHAVSKTLKDLLTEQLNYAADDNNERRIGTFIIDAIDENGYLSEPVDAISKYSGFTTAQIEKMLGKIQLFEPVGVAARTLSESLLIQLKILHPDETAARTIIEKGTDILEAASGWKGLADKFNFSADEISHAKSIIQSLVPYPGLKYYYEPSSGIEPEAAVWIEDDNINISMNKFYNIDVIKIDSKNLHDNSSFREAKEFARFVGKRRKSMELIIRTIVTHQSEFFIKGDRMLLKPLKLEDVADKSLCHISTVSRAVADKYISTPYGEMAIKEFFLKRSGSNKVSRQVVLKEIRELIENEDIRNRLSDKDIMAKLSSIGINIVRRTVVKYRSILNIKNAVERGKADAAI